MRFDGTLKVWHEDRGFGFIEPLAGGQDIFVHARALPRGGPPPRIGERMSFEVELNPEGKKRAVRVQRPNVTRTTASAKNRPATLTRAVTPPARHRPTRPSGKLVGIALVLGLCAFGYAEFGHRLPGARADEGGRSPAQTFTRPETPAPNFRCDGRQHCSQMASCAEAKFFLAHCPGTKMDGDHDGIPCEDQLCR